MKFKSLLLLCCFALFIVACSDDDDDDDQPVTPAVNNCTISSDYASNIVGSWEVSICMGSAPVIISADSTFQDPDECLIGSTIRPATEKRYEIVNDTITFTVSDSIGFLASLSLDPPTENCTERIRFGGMFGFQIIFTRQ